jgi:hypothetical protein
MSWCDGTVASAGVSLVVGMKNFVHLMAGINNGSID